MKTKSIMLPLALAFCAGLPNVQALSVLPSITWGTPQNISSDSDVNASGTLVNAFNVGPGTVASTAVNGVTFSPFGFPPNFTTTTVTNGNYTFTETEFPNQLDSRGDLGSLVAPFSSLSSGYQTLLSSVGGTNSPDTLELSITGLTAGQPYLIQFWVSNSNNAYPLKSVTLNATTNAVTLNGNTANAVGGVGQFVTGTFTGNTSLQAGVSFNGADLSSNPYVNAFQLRAIPEPSTWSLLASGAAGLLAFRRRTRV